MAIKTITQLHRVAIRQRASKTAAWQVVTLNEDDLSQGDVLTVNIAPRKISRASQRGTTNTPLKGTFDNFTATLSLLGDTWKKIGEVIDNWNDATYAGADDAAGNMSDDTANLCPTSKYVSVVVQGVCDDGSTGDFEICRCNPSLDDDLAIGSSETPTISIALNPIIYNPTLHADDGYTQKSYNAGDNSLTQDKRFDFATGDYVNAPISA